MFKRTKIFYPHIVKQYDTIDQFVAENNYEDYYSTMRAELQSVGINISDVAQYKEALSDDGFEAISTVVFNDSAHYDSYLQIVAVATHEDKRVPIFEENSEDHLI